MTRTYRPLLLPLTLALLSPVVGCSGSDSDVGASGDSSTSTSSSSGGNTTSSSSGGNTTSSSSGGNTTSSSSGGNTTSSSSSGDTTSSSSSGDTTSSSSGGTTEKFSFFVTSLVALQELSGSQDGFGGDLRFGETGPGAGLRGADKICATIAEKSLPGAGSKPWRAFLSAVAGEDGKQVNAIDRIGEGPWYDRLGRLLANNKEELLNDRPTAADPAIIDDFPNEDGVPNHQPDPSQPEVDNHDMLTGTNDQGQLYSATATCKDWTAKSGDSSEGRPRVGHSWPRNFGGGGGSTWPAGSSGAGGPGGSSGAGGPGGNINMANWMSSLDESGCAPGINLLEQGGPLPGAVTVGSGGGYGGFYCFALTP
ncbi:hypothetical protein WMF39_42460 [Sorangium sp. So ce1504]|uniref:hypothetical protein n=1 Tax=Sorangium sp. So ce1504 TaxID=3133337 RepID=UPI003F5E979F